MTRRMLSELVAIGVAEADSPPVPWRSVPLVFQIGWQPGHHFWPNCATRARMEGFDAPESVFERHVEEGLATRLRAPFPLKPGQVLVCAQPGEYSVRSEDEVALERGRLWKAKLAETLEAAAAGDWEAAEESLERARLAEERVPVSTVFRLGLANDLPVSDPWREEAVESFCEEALYQELDRVRESLEWEALPHRDLRERWYYAARTAADRCSTPPSLEELLPVPGEYDERAVRLLLALRTRGLMRLASLPSLLLSRITSGEPTAIDQAIGRLSKVLGCSSPTELLESLDAFIHAEKPQDEVFFEQLRAQLSARTRESDYYRHARLLARLEQTIGETARSQIWRRAAAQLNSVTLAPWLAPWRKGEEAAKLVRECFARGPTTISRLKESLERSLGLRVFATCLPSESYDACHVSDRSIAPASYVDTRRAGKGSLVRFSLAQALGILALMPRFRGATLCRGPQPEAEREVVSDEERAARAFAAYFIAPRQAVQAETANLALETVHGYRTAVMRTMSFGLSAYASFPHVANCNNRPVPWPWMSEVFGTGLGEAGDEEWEADRVPVPELPAGLPVRLERADGFASLLARAERLGALPEGLEPTALLGDSSNATRDWFQERLEEQARSNH